MYLLKLYSDDVMPVEERINLRTSRERKQFIATAAAYSGTSLSAFLLEAAEQRARAVMEEQTSLHLTCRDWETFAQLMDDAEDKPRPKLAALVSEFIDS